MIWIFVILVSSPEKSDFWPSIGNGYLGTVVHSPEVYMNGLYNGRHGDSHRAAIPSTVSVQFAGTEPATPFERKHQLRANEGATITTL